MTIILMHDKHEAHVINATNRERAVLALFDLFDSQQCYIDLTDPHCGTNDKTLPQQKVWYAAAKAGDAAATLRLLDYRRRKGYEYEDRWRFTEVIEPARRTGEACAE